MAFCQYCSKEIEKGSGFCPHCGARINPTAFDFSYDQIVEEDFRTFIGKNADHYLNKFRIFQTTGGDNFAVTWNWPAFWMGFVWMLYRKMYLWALVAFLIALTPVGFPLTMIGWGIVGNYLYYLHARKKILTYKSHQVTTSMAPSLDQLGGVNRWVWYLGIIFILFILAVGVLGFLLFLHFLKYKLFYLPKFIEI